MQSAIFMIAGVACLVASVLVFIKVAPKDGEEPAPWLKKDGMAMGVSIGLIMGGTFGVGLLIRGLAG